jgi:hypothetical protein
VGFALGLLEELAISEENYQPPLDPETLVAPPTTEKHHHIYMKTKNGMWFEEISKIIEIFTGEENWSRNIQSCKSKKATILYITKYEKAPYLYNVRVSECSLYTRAWHHAITTYNKSEKIQYSHPFLVSSGIANYRFVTGIIQEHMDSLTQKILTNRPTLTIRPPFRLHPHYAIYIKVNQTCRYTHDISTAITSMQNIYIEGPPGYGKTELIDTLTKGRKIFKAGCNSNFMWGGLREDIDIIWFEDFSLENYKGNIETILSLMDKKETTVSEKGKNDRTIYYTGQFIFISNYPIPIGEERFQRRIKHHYINHKIYECKGCRPDYIPDNQLGLFDINGDQLMLDLDEMGANFTLDISDENANDGQQPRISRFISTGLSEICAYQGQSLCRLRGPLVPE